MQLERAFFFDFCRLFFAATFPSFPAPKPTRAGMKAALLSLEDNTMK